MHDHFAGAWVMSAGLNKPGWSQRVGAKRRPMTGSAKSGYKRNAGPGLRFAPSGLPLFNMLERNLRMTNVQRALSHARYPCVMISLIFRHARDKPGHDELHADARFSCA